MEAYADYFGIEAPEEKEKWRIAELINDADWEKYPEEHPKVIVEWLKEQNSPEDLVNAVEAYGFNFGVEAKTLMAKVLRAVDELIGLIVATALVKGRNLDNVTFQSILKKWKDKRFVAGVNREDIERGAQEINVPLEKHIEIVLEGMKRIERELGL
ncbi:MAG: HDIG domain-containing protein [Patescibacteria group bacterium]|nr:MAG: HDIG domain-containing protein [Patescibacteria group bacterium]